MRIVIVGPAGSDPSLVMIRAAGIFGTALWKGNGQPTPETEQDVEVEVRGEVDWRDVVVEEGPGTRPYAANGKLVLQGLVEDCDQEGVLTLRVARSLVLIDTTGEPPLGVVGRHVTVVAHDAEVFPTNV